MENILYLVAAVLAIFWLIGVVGYSAGGLIHVLLVMAVITSLVEFISSRRKRI